VEGDETILYVNNYYEKNLTTGVVTTYYYLGGKLIAKRTATTLDYVHQDSLSSTTALTSYNGTQNGTTVTYYPYGSVRSGSVSTDKLFTGQRSDSTGLYYYGARYYDPTMGRFISADTIVPNYTNPQALNRYSYTLNNPLIYIDPSGHWSWKEQLSGSWEVIKGYGDAITNMVTGIALTVADPIGTSQAIANAIVHPIESYNTIKANYSEKLQSNRGLGEITGEILITAATLGLGLVSNVSSKTAELGIIQKEVCLAEKSTGVMSVYRSFNPLTGEVNYIGITNNLERRAAEQLLSKGIEIEGIEGLSNLSMVDARAAEQVLIEYYGLGKNDGSLLNEINSISPLNPIYNQSISRGNELLQLVNYIGW
jgi:RHS repeat-associated protein